MSFAEAMGERFVPPSEMRPAPIVAEAATSAEPATQSSGALASAELHAALVGFAARARFHRAKAERGAAMPPLAADNWEELLAALDAFLLRRPGETSSFDVVRARVTTEAELELDARAYGDFPPELAEATLERVTRLAVRMAELRRLRVKTLASRPPPFVWPVQPVAVTSIFGRRLHPISRAYKEHFGVDLAAADGQVVFAAATGTVMRAGWNGAHGRQVEIQHAGGVVTRYSHLSELLVDAGTTVSQGDTLGLAGSTGLSTGTHLHFEMWRDGQAIDPLEELSDPAERPASNRAGPLASR